MGRSHLSLRGKAESEHRLLLHRSLDFELTLLASSVVAYQRPLLLSLDQL